MWVSHQVNEAKQSIVRSTLHGTVLIGSSIFAKRAIALGATAVGGAAVTSTAIAWIPSMVGEVTEQIVRCTSTRIRSRIDVDNDPRLMAVHEKITNITVEASGVGVVGLLGLAMGGPIGSVASITIHQTAKRCVQKLMRRQTIVSQPADS